MSLQIYRVRFSIENEKYYFSENNFAFAESNCTSKVNTYSEGVCFHSCDSSIYFSEVYIIKSSSTSSPERAESEEEEVEFAQVCMYIVKKERREGRFHANLSIAASGLHIDLHTDEYACKMQQHPFSPLSQMTKVFFFFNAPAWSSSTKRENFLVYIHKPYLQIL